MKVKALLKVIVVSMIGSTPSMAQLLNGPGAMPQYKYSTPMPPSVSVLKQ